MLQNIRAVLFDLDGVVVFTDRFHFRAWKEMADANGWTFDDEVNHRLRGVPRMRSLEIIPEHNGISLPDEEMAALADRKNSDYVRMLQDIGEADLVPHVLGFIESLRSRGIKTALCSASKNAQFVLDRLGIGHLFDTVVTGNDVVRNKPEPEIFLKAAQRLGLHPFNCFVVEDAEAQTS
jgi:beta-phosphoglucomutase